MDDYNTIETFKNNLIMLINNSHLTIGCAYYVLKDVYKDVERAYMATQRKANSSISQGEMEIPPMIEDGGTTVEEIAPQDFKEVTENDEQNND